MGKSIKEVTIEEQIQDICYFIKADCYNSLEKAKLLIACLELRLKVKEMNNG